MQQLSGKLMEVKEKIKKQKNRTKRTKDIRTEIGNRRDRRQSIRNKYSITS